MIPSRPRPSARSGGASRRTYGAAPRRLARPLGIEEIRQILAGIDRTTPIGFRDAAMILLGYASAMRRAEIVALTLADVEHQRDGLLLTVRKSKMDQDGHGELMAVATANTPTPTASRR
jgi:integrase